MSDLAPKRRDIWDKADLLTKILSAVVLLWFTVVVKDGTEDIATAMRKGELVQRLIGDLTASPDAQIRQDLAIIALDGSVRVEDSEESDMVAAIVDKLFESRVITTAEKLTNDTAFQVLRKRSPVRAAAVQQRMVNTVSLPEVRQKIISPATPEAGEPPPASSEAVPEATAAATVFANMLYIQFQGALTRETINELRGIYQQEGLGTPAAERLAGKYKSSVRYFHDADGTKANEVADRATSFFEGQKCPLKFEVEQISSLRARVPMGQLELWINHSCG
jgi:hypothetical protein